MTAKKTETEQKETASAKKASDESTTAWRTPAGISAIIGAIALLMTAAASLISALPKPTPTPTSSPPTAALAPTPTQDLCVGTFDGAKVTNGQIGVPIDQALAINPDETIAIKFNDETHLVIALRLRLNQKYYNVLKENCFEAVPWQTFDFDKKYTIDIDGHTLEFEYSSGTNKISTVARKK